MGLLFYGQPECQRVPDRVELALAPAPKQLALLALATIAARETSLAPETIDGNWGAKSPAWRHRLRWMGWV